MANYIQLCQRLRQECRVAGNGPASLTNQTMEYQRLITWTNEAWMEIQRANPTWRFLRASCSCPTVQGRFSYSATDFNLTDFGSWALDYENGDTFRNYANPAVTISIASPGVITLAGHNLTTSDTVVFGTTGALPTGLTAGTRYYVVSPTTDGFSVATTANGTAINTSGTQSGTHTVSSSNTTNFVGLLSETDMWPMDYDQWRNAYQFGATRTTYSRPVTVAVAPNDSLVTGPTAAAGYTLIGDYFKKPTNMTAATDTPSMPEQFHMLIVYKAMEYYAMSEAAPEILARAEKGWAQMYRALMQHQGMRLSLGGALA